MARIKRVLLLVLLIVLMSLLTSPVYAITNPDSGPYILQVDAYQNLAVSGDALFVVRVNIPYATPPSESSSNTFLGRLLLSAEEVQATTLYSYHTGGYNYNTFAIYESSGITWEGSYAVELSGSPTLEWSGDTPVVSTTSIDWHTSGSTFISQSWLTNDVLGWASTLSSYWSVVLLSTIAGGSTLSSYGVQYFTNVIPYLDQLCPAVLPTGQDSADYEDLDFQDLGATDVTDQWPFDFSGMSDWLGLPDTNLLHILIAFALVFAMCVFLKLDYKMSAVLGFSAILLLTIPGFLSPTLAAAFIFVAILGTGLVFILGKAT